MRIPKLAAPALALALTSPFLAYSSTTLAADTDVKPATGAAAKLSPQDQAMLNFSEAGHSAMRDIRGARFAIFNGDPKNAMKLMESAKTSLGQAQKDVPVFDVSSKMMVGGKLVGTASERREMERVPVDGQILLADNFVATPEKQAHIDKANEHFKKGNHAKALEELRLGEIDVNYTRLWIPIAQSERHLNQAIKLASNSKYYEANLALKAIEDSATADSLTLRDLPKSAAK